MSETPVTTRDAEDGGQCGYRGLCHAVGFFSDKDIPNQGREKTGVNLGIKWKFSVTKHGITDFVDFSGTHEYQQISFTDFFFKIASDLRK